MSILTKALVVLVTVLAVVLVALVVPFVATQNNLNGKLADRETELEAAKQSNNLLNSELTQAQQSESERYARLQEQNQDLISQIERANEQKQLAQAQTQKAKDQLNLLNASYATLSSTMKQQQQLAQTLQNQLDQSQNKYVDQQTRVIQLADRNDELLSERDSAKRQVRHMKENMTGMQETSRKLQKQIAQIPDDIWNQYNGQNGSQNQTAQKPSHDIVGKVTRVNSQSGSTLVQVNVGKTDDVAQGMKFFVHRDNNLVGTMVVSSVDASKAVGRMDLVKSQPRPNDAVFAGAGPS